MYKKQIDISKKNFYMEKHQKKHKNRKWFGLPLPSLWHVTRPFNPSPAVYIDLQPAAATNRSACIKG